MNNKLKEGDICIVIGCVGASPSSLPLDTRKACIGNIIKIENFIYRKDRLYVDNNETLLGPDLGFIVPVNNVVKATKLTKLLYGVNNE